MDPYRQAADASRPGRPPPPNTASGRVDGVWAPREQQGAAPFRWSTPGAEARSATEQRPETTPAMYAGPPSHVHPRVPEPRPPADVSLDPPTVPTLVAPERAPGSPPPEVRAAFWLWLTAVALGVIGSIVALVHTRAVIEQEMRAIGRLGTDQVGSYRIGPDQITGPVIESIMGRAIAAVVVAGTIGVLLHVIFAVLMRRGHGWARIVLAVIGALTVASAAYRMTVTSAVAAVGTPDAVGTVDPLTTVVLLLQIGVLLAAVVLFFRPRANHFYRTESVRREVSRARRAMTR